jgi:MFS family permease
VKRAEKGNVVENLVDDIRDISPRLNHNQVAAFGRPGQDRPWTRWILSSTLCWWVRLCTIFYRSGIAATPANVGYGGGLLFALFMIGWGTALIWGPIADRFGRVRTMMFSIRCFHWPRANSSASICSPAMSTLLSAVATGVWSLAILRLLAGVGIGVKIACIAV